MCKYVVLCINILFERLFDMALNVQMCCWKDKDKKGVDICFENLHLIT